MDFWTYRMLSRIGYDSDLVCLETCGHPTPARYGPQGGHGASVVPRVPNHSAIWGSIASQETVDTGMVCGTLPWTFLLLKRRQQFLHEGLQTPAWNLPSWCHVLHDLWHCKRLPRHYHTECRPNCIHFPSHLHCKLPAVTKINTTWQACTYPSHRRRAHRRAFPPRAHTEQIRGKTHHSLLTSFIPSKGPRPHYVLGLRAGKRPGLLSHSISEGTWNTASLARPLSSETPGAFPASGKAQHPALQLPLCCPAPSSSHQYRHQVNPHPPGLQLAVLGTQAAGPIFWNVIQCICHTGSFLHLSHWGPQLKYLWPPLL